MSEKTILDVLAEVRKRPGMYVRDYSHEEMCWDLEILIRGYELAVDAHNIESDISFFKEFGDYLSNRFGWSMSCGPIRAIEFQKGSWEKAWEFFWVYLDEFKAYRENA